MISKINSLNRITPVKFANNKNKNSREKHKFEQMLRNLRDNADSESGFTQPSSDTMIRHIERVI